jgi:hypothetical protein
MYVNDFLHHNLAINLVLLSTLAVLTMVLFLDCPNALYSPAHDDLDLDEAHSVSFLSDNDGMDEQGGHGDKCSIGNYVTFLVTGDKP